MKYPYEGAVGMPALEIKDKSDLFQSEIFNKEGMLLARVPAPIRFCKHRIYGDKLYLVDPYFETCIYVYNIVEK